jgi:hypothetical protein
MKRVNFTVNGKGGVGKTLISWVMAQFHQSTEKALYCADTDPTNASFARFKALGVEHILVTDKNMIVDKGRFDGLMEKLFAHPGESVIDTGAATFLPLMSYMRESGVLEMLKESGVSVVMHVPIVGGVAMKDTMTGLQAIVKQIDADIVVWENSYFGPIGNEDMTLSDTDFIKAHADRILGHMFLKDWDPATFGKDLRTVMGEDMTIDQAMRSPDFHIMQRQRLTMMKRDLFDQLGKLGF